MSSPRQRESAIQRRVKAVLANHGWHVEVLSCNAFQKGIPDLYAFKLTTHSAPYIDGVASSNWACEHHRWIDVKRPKGGTLTKSQVQKWSLWESIGLGVWILTGQESNPEDVLFGEPNWRDWWKPRYEKYLCNSPADLLRQMNDEQCDIRDGD